MGQVLSFPDLVERPPVAESPFEDAAAALGEAGEEPAEPLTVLGSLDEVRVLGGLDEVFEDGAGLVVRHRLLEGEDVLLFGMRSLASSAASTPMVL